MLMPDNNMFEATCTPGVSSLLKQTRNKQKHSNVELHLAMALSIPMAILLPMLLTPSLLLPLPLSLSMLVSLQVVHELICYGNQCAGVFTNGHA